MHFSPNIIMSDFNKESWEDVRGLSWVILDDD